MSEEQRQAEKWYENVILVDADYVDKVAFDLTVNFERMIGRRIPPADLARWIDCVALDGGMKPQEGQQTSVVFIHDRQSIRMHNFVPSDYASELHGQAFSDTLGEFVLSAYPVEDTVVDKTHFFTDVARTICNVAEVKRVMIVPDAERMYEDLRHVLRDIDDDKHITLFGMQPMPGGNFKQEILGYSLMAALGIRSDEIGAE